jgi:hypothetical protein
MAATTVRSGLIPDIGARDALKPKKKRTGVYQKKENFDTFLFHIRKAPLLTVESCLSAKRTGQRNRIHQEPQSIGVMDIRNLYSQLSCLFQGGVI